MTAMAKKRLGLLMCLLLASSGGAAADSLELVRCRMSPGPWRSCQMEVQEVGQRWELLIGGERIRFHHDGHGTVRMQRQRHPWQVVEPRWNADSALCWDGVCAQGDFPLD